MELTESIETINQRLIDNFGLDTITSKPMYRVVWADDQLEKRLMAVTPAGIELVQPRVMEVKKYNYIHGRYILENLVLVPITDQKELCDIKISYECLFVFENSKVGYLPPKWEVCKFVIDTVNAARGKSSLAKYKMDPEATKKRIDEIQEYLYADETDVSDALTRKEGVVLDNTSNWNREN